MVLGKTFSGARRKPILAADDRWVTLHPGGKGPKADGSGNKKGVPCLLDDQGNVKGGLGGRFNGVHIKDVSKKSKEARASKAASPAKKPEAPKKFEIKASTAPEIPRPSARPTTPADEHEFDRYERFESAAKVKGALVAAELANGHDISDDVKDANTMDYRDLAIWTSRRAVVDEAYKIPVDQNPTKLAVVPDRALAGKIKLFGDRFVDEADVTLSSRGNIIAVSDKVLTEYPELSVLVGPKRTAAEVAKLRTDRESGKAAEEAAMRAKGFKPYNAERGEAPVGSHIEITPESPTPGQGDDVYSVVSVSGYQGNGDRATRVYIAKVEDEDAEVPEGHTAESWAKTVPPKSKPRDWATAAELVARGAKDPKKFAPASKVKEVNSPLTSMVRLSEPLRVVKETAKAVNIGGASGVASSWIPKSCVEIKDGEVRSVKKSFFLEKFSTSMAESAKEELNAARQASASYARPPAGFRRAKYPFAILRETDKAVGIKSWDRNGQDELQWFPKSQVLTHSGYVIFATSSILNAKGQYGGALWTSK